MAGELSELIGYPAAVLTTAAFVPQAWKSWRTRDLSGISLPMYALFSLGVALWLKLLKKGELADPGRAPQ